TPGPTMPKFDSATPTIAAMPRSSRSSRLISTPPSVDCGVDNEHWLLRLPQHLEFKSDSIANYGFTFVARDVAHHAETFAEIDECHRIGFGPPWFDSAQ